MNQYTMTYEQYVSYSEAIEADFSNDEALQYAGFVKLNGEWVASFNSQAEAIEYIASVADDPCTDNYRFTFDDDSKGIGLYEDQKAHGCCGFLDVSVVVAGRSAMVGCNYGH